MSNTWRPRDVAGLLLIAGLITTAYHNKESQTAPVQAPPQYKAGEMIFPDYAIRDTLIVVDPVGLNRDIVNASTDWEISEVMYLHCAILGQEQTEYGVNIAEEGYQVIDNAYKNSVTVPWNVNFDSLMMKLNE